MIKAHHLPRSGLGLILLVAAHLRMTEAIATAAVPLPEGATLLFEDDFNRSVLEAYAAGNIDAEARKQMRWTSVKGSWETRHDESGNGYLCGSGTPGELLCDRAAGINFRLEYTTWSTNVGDRGAIMALPLPNFVYKVVYLFQIGGGNSRYNRIYREGKPLVAADTTMLPRAGVRQRVVIQKQDDLLEMFVDGQRLYAVKDPEYSRTGEEISGPMGVSVGLMAWNTDICFDDVKIYNLPGPRREVLAANAAVEFSLWRGFGTVRPEPPPDVTILGGGIENVPTLVNLPEPVGHVLTNDYCAAIGGAQD
ncbi:MAG: hypothetical protein PHR35_10015, partial [Kiritimatiellae bacterium]|nr:hypothetical protein [Kiritimatiellia bacterium]